MTLNMLLRTLLLLALSALQLSARAESPAATVPEAAGERSIAQWLLRLHEASQRRAYIGTLVVSSGGIMSSARVWHVCDGQQQL